MANPSSPEEFLHELLHGSGKYPYVETYAQLKVLPVDTAIQSNERPATERIGRPSFLRLRVEGEENWLSGDDRVAAEAIPLPASIIFLPRHFQDQAIGDNS